LYLRELVEGGKGWEEREEGKVRGRRKGCPSPIGTLESGSGGGRGEVGKRGLGWGVQALLFAHF